MGGGDGEGRGKADPAPDKAEATLGEGKQKMKLFKLDFGAERRELTHTATKDMLPKNETVLVHDLRTSVGVAARAALEKAGGEE